MVNYGHVFSSPRPYYATHEMNGGVALAPYGVEHRGPLPDIRTLNLLPGDFPPRRTPGSRNMRGRNPGLYVNTHNVQQGYLNGQYDDTTSYYGCY